MLENISERLQNAIRFITRQAYVSDKEIAEYLREIQRALIMGDVDVKLVSQLTENIKRDLKEAREEYGISIKDRISYLTYKELVKILGGEKKELRIIPNQLNVFVFMGIQGSGKTTTVGKIAHYLRNKNVKVGVIAGDVFRPGAVDQLKQLLKDEIPLYSDVSKKTSIEVIKEGIEWARKLGLNVVLVDTAGRHRSEESLMEEMAQIINEVNPTATILVIDAMIGQQARVQAEAFNKVAKVGYVVVTKMDGSAKGGGALSAIASVGAPIIFIGIGESIDEIEEFDPVKFVSRLLGKPDLESLVKRVQKISKEEMLRAQRMTRGRFTIEEFVQQLESARKMGGIQTILSSLPGGAKLGKKEMEEFFVKVKKWRAIVNSMNKEEREDVTIMDSSRVRRVAKGSGTSEKDVRELIKQYTLAKKAVKKISKGAFRNLPHLRL
ncbi:MAG: signal recognition particle receptor subunit alpha [Crenarchaeota archaeon]|nr:signal recognition particle receptor subunit alpha [Thermoproteota archaeon]MDW8034363.1 signal recognition particle receptor subunit alpha [Nitrososphaerota archaeon]